LTGQMRQAGMAGQACRQRFITVQADIQGIASRGGQCRVAGQGIAGRQAGHGRPERQG
jgi:hypothetical protein